MSFQKNERKAKSFQGLKRLFFSVCFMIQISTYTSLVKVLYHGFGAPALSVLFKMFLHGRLGFFAFIY